MDAKLKKAINKAETLSKKNGNIFFIYDINPAYNDNIEYIEDDYFITDDIFNQYPSRRSIYDTQFKELESHRKFEKVYKILERLKFIAASNNMGSKYEQLFYKSCDISVSNISILQVIIKPNMMVVLKSINSDGEILVIYQGFFNIVKIFNILSYHDTEVKPILRDIVIDSIFE
jgi:hypothetical protein